MLKQRGVQKIVNVQGARVTVVPTLTCCTFSCTGYLKQATQHLSLSTFTSENYNMGIEMAWKKPLLSQKPNKNSLYLVGPMTFQYIWFMTKQW